MTKISRRVFNLLAGASAVSLLGSQQSLAATQVPGGTIIVQATEPAVLTAIDRNGPETISAKIFEGLVDHDRDLKPIPALATSWDISEDGLRHTFHLRDGVKWHDGTEFSSADVAYSILTLKEVHPRRRATFANLVDVETPDRLTATLVFSTPVPFLYGALGGGYGAIIFPRHLYEGQDLATNPYQSAPVGTGPYVFKEWARGSHVLVERNPDYWGNPRPYADRVVLRFVTDIPARVAALETGELDFVHSGVPYNELNRLKAIPNLVVTERLTELNAAASQLFFNLDIPILQDIRVRKAIAHAIDIERLIAVAYHGYARPAPTVIGPNQPAFHNPDIKPYAFDVALANQLLDEAGLVADASGKRFSLRILYNPIPYVRDSVEYIRSALAEIGIVGDVQNYDYATYVTKVYTDREFDVEVEVLANGYDPTDGVQRGYWSKSFKPGLPWSNAAHYLNARVDEIFETAAAEPDQEKRRALYFELQQIVYDELPSIGLAAPDQFAVVNKRLADALLVQSYSFADAHIVQG